MRKIKIHLTLLLLLSLVGSVAVAQSSEHIPWYITLHAGEAEYDTGTLDTLLTRTKELGVKGIRTDIFWADIEPKEGQWNEANIAFYRAFFSKIRAHDLDIMMILSGAPSWAKDLYKEEWENGKRGSDNKYWAAYNIYIEKALDINNDQSKYVQVWNESNLGNYSHVDASERWMMFSLAGAEIRTRTAASIMVNVFVGRGIPWKKDVESWLEKSGEYIDVVGLDHFPMTWSLYSVTDWSPVKDILNQVRNQEGVWAGKRVAIAETGFSSWIPGVGESLQNLYIENTLGSLYKIFREDPTLLDHTELLAWYQLVDNRSGWPTSLNISDWLTESKFGVLMDHANGYQTKGSFQKLKEYIQRFYQAL
ncbi:MAG: hypothetical protein AB7T49_18355 [Oligoflexales bacterium]